MSLGLWGAVLAFLGLGLASFFIPQMKIKGIISRLKEEHLSESEEVLQRMLKGLCLEDCCDASEASTLKIKIDIYYQYFHTRIMAVKEWPFDLNVLLQILSSLIAPLLIMLVESLSR